MNNKKLSLVVLFLIPIVVISFMYKTNYFFNEKKEIKKEHKETILTLNTNGKIEELELENYIIGVVACEMPASFNEEAIKAQAVASRTYALKKMSEKKNYDLKNSVDNQCYNNTVNLKEKWKNNYDKYYNKIKENVLKTKGEYLTYKDEIITAFYFAMSNGYTENSELVFSETKPYLKTVESNWETNRKDFIDTKTFSFNKFLTLLDIKDKKITNITILSRSKTNRVKKIKVNNIVIKGTEFRKSLDLKSTDFKIEKTEDKIVITTKGYGHGVGMSQYGANGLANEGKNYKEILKYYYKNVEIKKV